MNTFKLTKLINKNFSDSDMANQIRTSIKDWILGKTVVQEACEESGLKEIVKVMKWEDEKGFYLCQIKEDSSIRVVQYRHWNGVEKTVTEVIQEAKKNAELHGYKDWIEYCMFEPLVSFKESRINDPIEDVDAWIQEQSQGESSSAEVLREWFIKLGESKFKELVQSGRNQSNIQECTLDLKALKNFIKTLSEEGFLKEYSATMWQEWMMPCIKEVQIRVDDWSAKIRTLNKACKVQQFNEKSPWIWNDGDQKAWGEEHGFAVKNQNGTFYVQQKNEKDWSVFWRWDEEVESWREAVQRWNIVDKKKQEDCVLEVEGGQVVWVNPGMMECWFWDLKGTFEEFKKNSWIEDTVNGKDLQDYDYLRKYVWIKYGMTELEWIVHILMVHGNGVHYNQEKRRYELKDVEWNEEIDKMQAPKDGSVKELVTLKVVPLKELNEDWRAGIERAMKQLKQDRPKIQGYDYQSRQQFKGKEQDAIVDEVILAYEKALRKNDRKRKKGNRP